MIIAGLQKCSLIDFPGKICAVIFAQGCNFSCPYCHNFELIPQTCASKISFDQVKEFLIKRQNQLEAVVFSGGEPALQPDLLDCLSQVKSLGYSVKLDTNGSNPQVLNQALNLKLLDFVAMDIKAPREKYNLLAGVSVDVEAIWQSMRLIKNSGVSCQFRTTFDTTFLNDQDIEQIRDVVGGFSYRVQECVGIEIKI